VRGEALGARGYGSGLGLGVRARVRVCACLIHGAGASGPLCHSAAHPLGTPPCSSALPSALVRVRVRVREG